MTFDADNAVDAMYGTTWTAEGATAVRIPRPPRAKDRVQLMHSMTAEMAGMYVTDGSQYCTRAARSQDPFFAGGDATSVVQVVGADLMATGPAQGFQRFSSAGAGLM